MSDAPLPPPDPLPAEPAPPVAPPVASRPAPARGSPPPDRVAGARSFASWTLGCTAISALCCGSILVTARSLLVSATAQVAADRAELEVSQRMTFDAQSLLDGIADQLVADANDQLPPILPQAPPKDPWGNAIQYVRQSRSVARLRSAGPDGIFDTEDDVEAPVLLR